MERSTIGEPAIIYRARFISKILGLPIRRSGVAPKTRRGQFIVYYGAWDLPTLRSSLAGQSSMDQEKGLFDYDIKIPRPGYYRLLLPVPSSDDKWGNQLEQLRSIGDEWEPAPVLVAATAVLVHMAFNHENLLGDSWCRCADDYGCTQQHCLRVRDSRLSIGTVWNGWRRGTSIAAAQKCRNLT